jgi:Leucine-rich repeat (LRR) protein
LKDTPHFELELSRAKQQFQMVNSFQQVFHHMQIQSKMLEKMSFRLDGMENEITAIKENKPQQAVIEQKYDYPVLAPIQKAEGFDTPEKRAEWWNGLEEQWQKAFKQAVLQKSQYHEPTDKDYQFVLESEVARFVGPRGMTPNMDFELTNLSGIKYLSNLTLLISTHQVLKDISGVEHLSKLKSLFLNGNKIKNIRELHYLPQLTHIYCNANQITNLQPIQRLTNLEVLYCCYNRLENLEGITQYHAKKLKEFVPLPNEAIKLSEIKRIEEMEIKCKKG